MLRLTFCWVLFSAMTVQGVGVGRVMGVPEEFGRMLVDGDRSPRSAVRLEFGGASGPPSLTMALPAISSVSSCTLWFVASRTPSWVEVETSLDLVRWERQGRGVPRRVGGGMARVVVQVGGATAQFVRWVFPAETTVLALAEIAVAAAPPRRLGRLEIRGRPLGEDRIEVVLEGDTEFYGTVRYAEDASALADGPLTAEYAKEHRFVLEGLERGTEYVLVGVGRDATGMMTCAGPVRVRTEGEPRPKILGWTAAEVGVGMAVLELRLNKPVRAEATVLAGDGVRVLATAVTPGEGSVWRLRLSGLSQETVYKVRVKVVDGRGDRAEAELDVVTDVSNAAKDADISGDFRLVGENIAPEESPQAGRRLVDGDWSYLKGSVMSLANDEDDRVLVLDFRVPRDLLRLELFWWALAYPGSFRVDGSRDGEGWEELHRGGKPAPLGEIRVPAKGVPVLVSVVPLGRPVRFLRCVFPKGCGIFRFPQYRNIRLLEVRAVPRPSGTEEPRAEWVR